ncbi:MAG: tRNA guanosine(34) transglycosylase Tgt [Bdellovibrionales bacterium CG10_big_fil_rev_8_21_14_0_10_45_34]|nr:MAG: tRNA guanosine(34) transglycosylase Tgt [Bdellovibrionales bacterium CG10_big_fil_rev_8_21_14_0_10_45_34]
MSFGSFQVEARAAGSNARAGKLHTLRGEIKTPVFMPVGTKATVKGMLPEELKQIGSQIILGNTYHLHLRPGEDTIKKLGGLHKFMNWPDPILTDSGGFQVFSLSQLRKIDEEGVTFKSHLDGRQHFIGPEKSMDIQMALGSDIIMAFDECPPHPCEKSALKDAVDRTHRWLDRCVKHVDHSKHLLFGIAQGGLDYNLRKESIEQVCSQNLPGYALGGFSVGEPIEEMHQMLPELAPLLPQDKPRYLMGVGTPLDLIRAIDAGIDMFDCVLPTRVARNGTLFTSKGKISIKREEFREDESSIDELSDSYTAKNYSKAYLRHLFMAGEILSARLNTIHNLHFYLDLMARARVAICEGKWTSFRNQFLATYTSSN